MAEEGRTESAPSTVRRFAFKQSALAPKADKIWEASKSTFTGTSQTSHVSLGIKTLDSVLGRMAADKQEQQSKESEPVFVFGSKISDRIIKDAKEANGDVAANGEKSKTAQELFQGAVHRSDETRDFRQEAEQAADEKKREQEKQLASTSIIHVHTGEENDSTIFQTACKLHLFDKERKSWVEKGLSQIRINKSTVDGNVHHRIVARTSGTQRVVINSSIFPDMLLERIDNKRAKISAMSPDTPGVQIFLVNIGFSKTDLCSDQFFTTLKEILDAEKLSDINQRKRKANDDDLSVDKVELEPKKRNNDFAQAEAEAKEAASEAETTQGDGVEVAGGDQSKEDATDDTDSAQSEDVSLGTGDTMSGREEDSSENKTEDTVTEGVVGSQ